MRFSVLIVNFNGGAYVQGALDSLKAQSFRDFEVILVDNASGDGSVDNLETEGLPQFSLMRETDNHGFARGNNLAAAQAGGEWLCLLNPDAEAAEDWLEKINEATRRHPKTHMFACLQIDLHNPERLDGIGDAYFGFGVAWRGGFGRSVSEVPGEGECFSPCGASAIYHAETFRSHDGFDERFFCFGEDTDLAFRMRAAGETCIFVPDAIVRHAGGALSGRVSEFALFHGARNRIWGYVKNMPGWSLWATLPGHVAITLLILGRGLMNGRFRDTWHGVKAGLGGLEPFWRDRRAQESARKVSTSRLLAIMCWNPWRFFTRRGDVRAIRRNF